MQVSDCVFAERLGDEKVKLLSEAQKPLTMWPHRVSPRVTCQHVGLQREDPAAALPTGRHSKSQPPNCRQGDLSRSGSRKHLGTWRNAVCVTNGKAPARPIRYVLW